MNFRALKLSLILCLSAIVVVAYAEDKKDAVVVETKTTAETKEEVAKNLELVTTLTPEWFSEHQKSFSEQSQALTQDRTTMQAKLEELHKNIEALTAQDKARAAEVEQAKKRVTATTTQVEETRLVSDEMLKTATEERSSVNDDVEKIRLDRQIAQKFSEQLQQELEMQEKALVAITPVMLNQTADKTTNSDSNMAHSAETRDDAPSVKSNPSAQSAATIAQDATLDKTQQEAVKKTDKLFELNSKVALLKQALGLIKQYVEVI